MEANTVPVSPEVSLTVEDVEKEIGNLAYHIFLFKALLDALEKDSSVCASSVAFGESLGMVLGGIKDSALGLSYAINRKPDAVLLS
jgi:hypothetical protein